VLVAYVLKKTVCVKVLKDCPKRTTTVRMKRICQVQMREEIGSSVTNIQTL